MTKGKRRYLLALVESAGKCLWCKKMLPWELDVHWCCDEHVDLWTERDVW